jgi:secernin
LERGGTATEALDVITQLLEKYGQGGPCSHDDPGFAYHNSFLIADPTTAWVLETSGKHWAAVEVTSGYRNISNALTITTKIDRKSDGLEEFAKSKGLWDGEVRSSLLGNSLKIILQGEFNFCAVFSQEKEPGDARYVAGGKLLAEHTSSNSFRETDMFSILRDKKSEICRQCDSAFPTQGSQVQLVFIFGASVWSCWRRCPP